MATLVCLICGTNYAMWLRREGDRCHDLSLVDKTTHKISAHPDSEDGCVGRVVSEADYGRIDEQAEMRRLATRQDLHPDLMPLLRRKR